ncbi:hypothetical protein [Rhodococcus sp. BH5]|uniref:hypothetical protein n=1 Tax=Rhodococcus sp. BH5 TaxID=2871702 RepID=UPI0022CD41ED|nr:hypothetical protein [Rhodococcus sp. BH5]MCZ9635142.1 hypothetical protein [Rhodococcus sp. BH5]
MTENTTPTAGSNNAEALRHNFTTRLSLSSLSPLGERMMWPSGGDSEARSDG